MKYHLHDEQFDDHYHSACGRVDAVSPDDPRARFFWKELGQVSYADRCRYCARINWPRGGEPPDARDVM